MDDLLYIQRLLDRFEAAETTEEEERLREHLTTKMIIAGTVSVSISSVVLASAVVPILFG